MGCVQLNKWHRGAQKRLDGQAGEKAIKSVHAVGTATAGCLSEVVNAGLAKEWVVLSAEQEADSDEGLDVFACDKCGREFLDLMAAEDHERKCMIGVNQHTLKFDPTLGKAGRCNVLSKSGRPCPQPKACCPYHSDAVISHVTMHWYDMMVATGSYTWVDVQG